MQVRSFSLEEWTGIVVGIARNGGTYGTIGQSRWRRSGTGHSPLSPHIDSSPDTQKTTIADICPWIARVMV